MSGNRPRVVDSRKRLLRKQARGLVGVSPRYVVVLALLALSCSVFAACAPEPDGAAVFDEHCATCHLEPLWPRAPNVEMLQQSWTPDLIISALSTGVMEEQGRALTSRERAAVAEFISGEK